LACLAEHGIRRVLIEGGADTISRFLEAGCLDRVHIVVAPIIIGSGRPSFALAPIDRADCAIRTGAKAYPLGNDVLFDCDLSLRRIPIGSAKKST
jgi:riboflavin biosynthesis pyrimidine reductase